MSAYSPFDRELTDLEGRDLLSLKEAAEGWYIEYKRQAPNASSIAKSIGAFANTYGGWLFYGVEEKSKEDAVAGAFPGIPRAEVDAALQRMRQAVAGQINPSPHFNARAVWGPCAEIGLADDHAVICAYVPWGPMAPYVHKNGHIYRRVADGSEPKPESDRFLLDQLWRRSDDLRNQYADWVARDPEFSKGEGERPYVRLLLVADLWRERDAWADVSVDDLRAIMGQAEGVVGSVPFDTVYTSATGFVARQAKGNDPHNLSLTWRFRPTLVSDVLIPLRFHAPDRTEMLRYELDGYDGADRFVDALERRGHKSPRVVDLNLLFNVLIGVVEIQQRLMKRAGWADGYFVKARLLNVWRTIPFIDVPAILDGFEEHGAPMCLDGDVTTPAGSAPDTFADVPSYTEVESEHARVLMQALLLFAPVARAFGLPAWINYDPEDETPAYYEELQRAGRRAIDVQRARHEAGTEDD